MSEESVKTRVISGRRAKSPLLLMLGLHGIATCLVAGLLAATTLDRQLLVVLVESVRAGFFAHSTLLSCLGHLALSAGLWACIYTIFCRLGRRSRLALPPLFRAPRAGGSIFVETLIVMPVALLFIFGLAQLALINIANVMVNAATFEAARAAWLWMPETHSNRMGGLTKEAVEEKARIQASLTLLPVAPGEYRLSALLSESAEQARGMVVASQIPIPGNNSGAYGLAMAEQYTKNYGTTEINTSIARALDSSRMIKRSARKFDAAYASTRVHISEVNAGDQPRLQVKVVYRHLCTMPLVAPIFGDLGTAEATEQYGTHGYFVEFIRVFERQPMIAPARGWPRGETTSPILFL